MLELTAENVVDFCRERGWLGEGSASAELLGGGVSNAVFRVEADSTCFILKQSRPQLRTRETWFSDIDRVWREMKALQTLGPWLPAGTVPEVLHQDREHFVFTMSHAPRPSSVWKEDLLAGRADPQVARHAGLVLGRIHQESWARRDLLEEFRDRNVFRQLRTDPFYRRVQERCPQVAGALGPLIGELESRSEAICHGDFSPKNILVHAQGFTLVDYETAHLGDPAMDLGFFLSHLLLKGCKLAPRRADYFALTRAFWEGYLGVASFAPARDLPARGAAHLGVCLLARIDGTSPVDYLPEEPKREAVRALGCGLLLAPPDEWEDVLTRAELAFAPLV